MKIDIIGDIHGCLKEFVSLTKKLGYSWESGLPVHTGGRKLAFVGDLTDRGPDSISIIKIVYSLVEEQGAYYVPGNHCNKLYRYLKGNNVKLIHGLETTAAELEQLSADQRKLVTEQFISLYEKAPLYHVLDHKRLVIAHAGIREEDIGQLNKRVTVFVLYGDITGEKNDKGLPVRRDWARHYKGKPWVVYGHTPVHEARFKNRTVNIDTGAVFGNMLTALRYPEMKTVSVKSSMVYHPEKFRDSDMA
ncbi:bis(5'-nucleosyl)-tetraphosphatase PrpE [Jeotgalibacillus salarius]|uniref:Bis(5'-nucleosyl)-tetraphosphatase PrpE n=1 Tax=Jeotgalibacillus salarius TaxID=546023 RepID=A0A4Y8LB64_9BACL|nr:bis(5'-nucleosyl)-tetraphosphatase PrpE [Jeotgalibacillus salarius]TFD99298.1 bis(5'-nucleosyl)-tetraphosphatase PrpE [Jeotgalibacillus salarius]